MTTNPEQPYVPIFVEEVAPSVTELLIAVREDISQGARAGMTPDDKEARVIASVVSKGVFIAAFITNKKGEHRTYDIPVESVYEMWQLKREQYEPEKGSWFSLEFTVEPDGFIAKTAFNYDKEVFSTLVSPAHWYIRPEEETELEKSVWSHEDYKEDLSSFPRSSNPEWLTEA